MRVADYVVEQIVAAGIETVFMVTGGGAMHLNDAFGRHPKLRRVFCHHEQACAIAAEAYFRVKGKPAAVNVTTGPGGINALNGVFGAYVDSVPMIVVSGQVRTDTISGDIVPGLRQFGDQEADIVSMARPITKGAVVIRKPSDVFEQVNRLITLATDGRPGPVWIDIPINIQAALVEQPTQASAKPEATLLDGAALDYEIDTLVERLKTSKRPVIIAGNGSRFSGEYETFLKIVETLGIPVTTVWNAHDLIWNEHPCYAGRPGADGDRAGNFVVQNCDLLLILGARMHIRQVGFNWQTFARAATKVMVDADVVEMNKPTLPIDHKINADLRQFLPRLLERFEGWTRPNAHVEYLAWCRARVKRYTVVQPYHSTTAAGTVSSYNFIEALFAELTANDIIVTGDGTAAVVTFKVARIKPRQRLFTNKGCASMGYDLPAAIGAAHARPGARVICITGDGSIMMNLQELQTIVGQNLPIKIFLLNNDGYHSIRQSQHNYFDGFEIGCGPASGLTFPDFGRIAAGFGIKYSRISTLETMPGDIAASLAQSDGPSFCEVMIDKSQFFEPRLSSKTLPDGSMVSAPLEDMAPFLDRAELEENMLIPLVMP